MVFDTLFGQHGIFQYSPQMPESFTVEDAGKPWNVTLREGLLWHDGEKVLARDCPASIQRWSKRDAFGQALMTATSELSASDDRAIRFRLKRLFPLLPAGQVAIADARDDAGADRQYRSVQADRRDREQRAVQLRPDRRVPGSRNVHERFDKYQPRESGTPD